MTERGESQRAGPDARWAWRMAETVSAGLLGSRRGRITRANPKVAELVGEKTPMDLEGRALDTLVMDAGGGVPDWVSSPAAGTTVECWLLRREKDPGEGWWEIQDLTRLRAVEAEVQQLSHQLTRANRELEDLHTRIERSAGEREELLTVVSHEL